MNQDLWNTVVNNTTFVLAAIGIAFILFAIAYIAEKGLKKKNKDPERVLTTKKIAIIGVFSAIAGVLMVFEFPVPFAPPFYQLDFGDLPALIGAFAMGPVAGVMIEFCKVIIKLFIKGTSTAFVGDLANFIVGCSLVLPASFIYMFKKNRKNAIISVSVGTLFITAVGSLFNYFYLIPTFSVLYGLPVDAIIAIGTKINGGITSLSTLVLLAVAPVNFLKGFTDSLITMLIYKKISPILKTGISHKKAKETTENQ